MAIPCGSGRMAGRLAVEIGRDAEASARWRSVTRGPSARVAGGPAASESPTGGSVLHTALDADPTWEPVSGGACAPAAARGLDQRLRGGSGDPTKIQIGQNGTTLNGYMSTKTDVFSFGILVLETVSGRKNIVRHSDDQKIDLLNYTWKLFEEGRSLEIVDPPLSNPDDSEQALLCIQLGLLCCQAVVPDRPDMHSVHLMLSSD
ncbi:cysteine-rich receptor-like protein kinase 8 [Sorghum bicolor]|nr:cysteine-rich receptor-like protein kinase 8 [Sorghum bicolor]|eukprot:XP_021303761.1 cysteine-rich receptor-like protein kinase 8 [Sorghum bicolor]